MPSMTRMDRNELYIGGGWVPSTGSGTLEVIDSATEEVIGTVPEGTTEDIDRAVDAAAAAFPSWSATPVAERTELLTKVSTVLGERTESIADLIAHEVGMPLTLSQLVQVGLPVAVVRLDGPGGGRLHLGAAVWAARSSCESRSVWSGPSPRGTTRCTRSPPRWPPPWPPAARSCSSRARWLRSTPSCWPTSSTSWACRAGCSTS